jgi:PAS domain S-box-containing protein
MKVASQFLLYLQEKQAKAIEEEALLLVNGNTAGSTGTLTKLLTKESAWSLVSTRKHSLRKFIPGYTQDVKEALKIWEELEEIVPADPGPVEREREQKMRDELHQSNDFLKAVIENIPHMIFVKEVKELRFVRFNQAGERLLGFSKNDLLGKNDYDFFPKNQADFFTAKDRAVLEKGELLDIPEEPIQTKFLGERWLHTKKIPVTGEDGKPLFLLGISEDITEQKKKDDAILELNKELEAFAYSISHDLRAPLRAIHGYAQILVEDHASKLNTDAQRLLDSIKVNALKMGYLIDELLAFSRLGRKEMAKSHVNMNELVEGVIREFTKDFPHKADIRVQPLLPVEADYGLIHQVCFNLLSNAVKYSGKSESPVIEISSRTENGDVIYAIKDNGAGFNMQYISKLFGVFQRLHHSSEFEGLGVGLAIVKRIISRHKGKVWAEGEPDKGATFYFSLPRL